MRRELKISAGARQIIILVFLIFLFRIVFVDMYKMIEHSYGLNLYDSISDLLGDSVGLIASIVFDIYFVFIINKRLPYRKSPVKRVIFTLLFILTVSVATTVIADREIMFDRSWEPSARGRLFASYLAALLMNAVIVIISDLIFFFRYSTVALAAEANKKRKAQYQYQQLKRQLNPHFLFNSLNNLDYLVQNGDNQRASDFIKKLAGVYRYLLNKEDSVLVRLEEELTFVEMYADLLQKRFTDGLILNITIDKGCYYREIIPCGLQILVENATKHNIVHEENPLVIDIFTEEDMVVVRNNFQPRINPPQSTGLGLNNIRKQYRDIARKEIVILQSESDFIVKLPLL